MDKPDVMILRALSSAAMNELETRYRPLRWDLARDRGSFLASHGAGCRALISGGSSPLTADMLKHMPDLQIVCSATAGYDGLSLEAMAARGIALTNTSPALRADVADTAIMLILAARRSLLAAHAHVQSGDWGRKGWFPLQRSVTGTRLGIVGMGSLGAAVAKRAEAFGMRIAYWNRRAKDVPWEFQPDLAALARQCDTLVLTVAAGPETAGLIDARIMDALGPEGLLVNIARGIVVDEEALIDALGSGRLGLAALDVFLNEPTPDPRLTSLPNVTLFPHHASGTIEARAAMSQLVLDNLDAFFTGKPLLSAVAYHA